MTIAFEDGEYEAHCDTCGVFERTGVERAGKGAFTDAIAYIKLAGWGIFRDRDGWRHECPECNEADGG